MEKRAEIQEKSKAANQKDRKSWRDLAEEEESKDANVEMMMQPQDFVTKKAEASNEAKIKQITETYEKDAASTKKTL